MGERGGPSRENLRKLVHVGMGFSALLLRFLPVWGAFGLAGAALVHNWFLLPRYAPALWRAGEEGHKLSSGIVLYPVAMFASLVLFRESLHLAAAVWGILAFGDGLASLCGSNFGGARLPWNGAKSWVGSLVFVVFGALAAAILLTFVSGRPELSPAIPFGSALLVGGLAALGAAAAESLPLTADDNVVAPLVAASILSVWALFDPALGKASLPEVLGRLPWALAGTSIAAALAWALRMVDGSGMAGGFVLGVGMWALVGLPGFALLALFVALGSAATRMGASVKKRRGVAQPRGGRRGLGHALANGGAALVLAFLASGSARAEILQVAMTAALATATFDTVATEIGQAFGGRPRRLFSRGVVAVGTPGAVSVAGTLAGAAGAGAVAALAWSLGFVPLAGIPLVVAAALLASTLESLAGAAGWSRRPIDHHALNLLATACGAAIAAVLVSGVVL